MRINVLKSKIHRAVVTDSSLDYIGSIEIDEGLMKKADILPNEQVHVVNLATGNRWITYALPAKVNSKIISVNGGGARLALKGDLLVIMSFAIVDKHEKVDPKICFSDYRAGLDFEKAKTFITTRLES